MKIDIIGRGNVGTHLFNAFSENADVVSVSSRDLKDLRKDSDIYLISVSDNAIEDIVAKISSLVPDSSIIAHTSGSTSIDILKPFGNQVGVFYPLQTFSKDVPLDYSEIPFFLEASNSESLATLKSVAKKVSDYVYEADSDKRRNLHIASVFACNFVNHLWTLSADFLSSNGLDFDMLRPLIKETTAKALHIEPQHAQTGPASRHDSKTISAHLESLNGNPKLEKLYRMLSDSIEEHMISK